MRKQLFEYGEKITSSGLLKKASKEEKQILNEFTDYMLISASQGRAQEAVREVLRLKEVTGSNLDKLNLEDLRYFLKVLKESTFSDNMKNKIKGFIQQFLKWKYNDWGLRFNNFDDIKFNSDAKRKKPITSEDVLNKEKIEALVKAEPSLFWKTFLIVQWEAALRTGEARALLWEKVEFEDDGFCTITVVSKKNRNSTDKERKIPLKEATVYLKNLKENQRVAGIQSRYVFCSPQNPNKQITKSVNLWFSKLTKGVLGKPMHNYILRHSRGTELRELIKMGKMSKDSATTFMGHSERMFDRVYSHMDVQDVKEIMKKQIYNFEETTPKKLNKIKELEKKIEKIQKELEVMRKAKDFWTKIGARFVDNLIEKDKKRLIKEKK